MKISAIAVLLLSALLGFAQMPGGGTFVLSDVRLIDGTGHAPVDHASLLIQNGKIAAISTNGSPLHAPQGATVLKLTGKTVMPGIINGHGHVGLVQGTSVGGGNYTGVNIERELVQYERCGVTTVMSLGMNKDLLYKFRTDQEKGEEGGATVLTAGRGIGVPGGVPPVNVGPDQIYRPATPEAARKAVREMAAHSPNLIKIWVDDNLGKLPRPNLNVDAAAIDEAHRANLRVAAHVYYLADAKQLIQDGVDILAHSVRDKPLDPDTVSLIKNKNIYYIPTLQLEESFYIYAQSPAWISSAFFRRSLSPQLAATLDSAAYKNRVQKDPSTAIHEKALSIAEANLRKLQAATAPIAFGTDSGANPYRIPGWAEHRELQLMVNSGMKPLEAIHCATEVNAKMLGLSDKTGAVQKGKQADLIVLDADPSQNIANTEKIAMVFHEGRRIKLAD